MDANLFGTADASASIARVDVFAGGDLSDVERGLPLWELANIGDASYAEAPLDRFVVGLAVVAVSGVTTNGILNVSSLFNPALGG